MADRSITAALSEFRAAHDFAGAWEYLRRLAPSNQLSAAELGILRWSHQPAWWRDISSRRCSLSRRQPRDSAFLRRLWSDADFMRNFHRLAPPLPASDDDLRRILQREFTSTVQQTRAVHWVILDESRSPWGLLSLTDISPAHRRAEILVGVLPEAPFALASRAMFMLFDFFFVGMKYNKLYTFIHPDNANSLRNTLHLGFRQEGYLREHVRDPGSGKFCDLIQTGLTRAEALSERNRRLRARLL